MTMSKEFIERITASNGSVFTGPGTNSYLIGKEDITLVDPGPKIDAHIKNLVKLAEGKMKKMALVACMAKLLRTVNSVIRNGEPFDLLEKAS